MKSFVFALLLSTCYIFTSCDSGHDHTPGGSTGTDSVQVVPPDSTVQSGTEGGVDSTAVHVN